MVAASMRGREFGHVHAERRLEKRQCGAVELRTVSIAPHKVAALRAQFQFTPYVLVKLIVPALQKFAVTLR